MVVFSPPRVMTMRLTLLEFAANSGSMAVPGSRAAGPVCCDR
jgi:hypothetical protein